MTLRHLRIFVTVCETGTVTGAGEKLYIAQPTISLAISELEDYYGIKLFDRIAKRLHITETGKQFLEYATQIIYLVDEMEQSMKNYEAVGVVRLGASMTIGNYLMPSYVQKLQGKYPQLRVEVTIDNSEIIERLVGDNKVDLALIEGSVHSTHIQSEPLMKDPLVFICSVTHPFAKQQEISRQDLLQAPFLIREKGSAVRACIEEGLKAYNCTLNPLWESGSTEALVKGVRAGLGLSIVPYIFVKESIEQQKIATFQVEGIALEGMITAIYHRNKLITPCLRDFIELCKEMPTLLL